MYRIGVDLGGTNIAVGLVDEKYNIIVKQSTPTLAKRPGEEIVDDIAALCRRCAGPQAWMCLRLRRLVSLLPAWQITTTAW